MDGPVPKILAVASAGGHFVQLCRLMPALDGCRAVFVTTNGGMRTEVEEGARRRGEPMPKFYEITDANRWHKMRLVKATWQIFCILMKERPDVVLTTGAAPGYLALRLAKILRARTIWIDSIANAEELSLSGQKIGRHADLWLTQWPNLAKDDGPKYEGAVL